MYGSSVPYSIDSACNQNTTKYYAVRHIRLPTYETPFTYVYNAVAIYMYIYMQIMDLIFFTKVVRHAGMYVSNELMVVYNCLCTFRVFLSLHIAHNMYAYVTKLCMSKYIYTSIVMLYPVDLQIV